MKLDSRCLTESQIGALLGNAMSAEERQRSKEHLAACFLCQAKVSRASRPDDGQPATSFDVSDADALTLNDPLPDSHVRLMSDTDTEADSVFEGGDGTLNANTIGDSAEVGAGSDASSPEASTLSDEEFARRVTFSGLMSADEVDAVRRSLEDSATTSLAEELVKRERITGFQAQALHTGEQSHFVFGNYVVIDRLGAGGMGTVFRAHHRRMKRLVALKVLPRDAMMSPEAVRRFHREVEAAAKLQHPNIAAAFDADESNGTHFLVMELVEGPNLAQYVKAHGPMTPGVAARLIVQAARGLAHAHDEGVVHRDIKPGNLIVDRRGFVKILDMGLAQLRNAQQEEGDLTQSGRVLGTVDYMAPEQAKDAKKVDQRADIYSLGCTLFFLIAGRPMSPSGSMANKLLWHQVGTPARLHEICPAATPELNDVFQRMVAKTPDGRQTSMRQLIEELRNCLEALPDSALQLDGERLPIDDGSVTLDADPDATLIDPALTSGLNPAATDGGLAPEAPAGHEGRRWMPIGVALAAIVVLVLIAAPWLRSLNQPPKEGGVVVAQGGESTGRQESDGGAKTKLAPGPQQDPPREFQSPHAAALRWVMQRGGAVEIALNDGVRVSVTEFDKLPRKPFVVIGIDLDETGVDDLAAIQTIRELQSLSVAGAEIDDAALKSLSGWRELWSLNLSGTRISNAGLKLLAELPQLRDLNLSATNITDQGVAPLQSLQKLETLDISDTRVGDVGARQLARLPKLSELVIRGSYLTSDAYAELKESSERLDVRWDPSGTDRLTARRLLASGVALDLRTRSDLEIAAVVSSDQLPNEPFQVIRVNARGAEGFNDKSIELLVTLPRIQAADLGRSGVTAKGIELFRGVQSLKRLDLGPLAIADEQLKNLRAALKDCKIEQTSSPDQVVAREVVRRGGDAALSLIGNDQQTRVATETEIPAGDFLVREIRMPPEAEVTEKDWRLWGELKGLHALIIQSDTATDADLESLRGAARLRDLSVGGGRVSSASARLLSMLPSLRRLDLRRTAIDGAGLKTLAAAPELAQLSLVGCSNLSGDDWGLLRNFRALRRLDLSATQVDDRALSLLVELKSLQELKLFGASVSDAGREELQRALPKCQVQGDPFNQDRLAARWTLEQGGSATLGSGPLTRIDELPRGDCQLKAIDLRELPQVDLNKMLELLQGCRQLRELDLSETKLRDEHLEQLPRTLPLVRLIAADTPIGDKGLASLADFKSLTEIDLSGSLVSGASLAKIAGLPQLRHLKLAGSRVQGASLAHLAKAAALETLDLSGASNIRDLGVSHLAALTNLRVLSLRGTGLSDKSLEIIGGMEKLEQLKLDSNELSAGGLGRLSKLVRLRTLNLHGTKASDQTLQMLQAMKQLRSLNVTGTEVTKAAVKSLEEAIEGLRIQYSVKPPKDPKR